MVLDTGAGAERTLDDLVLVAHRIGTAIESVIEGKPDAIRLAPPLILSQDEAAAFLAAWPGILDAVFVPGGPVPAGQEA